MGNHRAKAITAAVLALSIPAAVQAVLYQTGDLFAGVANGNINHYSSTGTLKGTYNIGAGGFTTGMAFDTSGNLYATGFSANTLAKFDNSGTLLNANLAAGLSTPESIVFDTSGNFYVGNLGNGIRKYDSAGSYLGSVITTRVDWLDLSADQSTFLHGTEGAIIYETPNVLNTVVPGGQFTNQAATAYALRILPDGSVLLADGANIKRFNSSGTLIQTYDTATENGWFSLNLDPDGTSFWSGDFGTTGIYKFDIATGSQLFNFSTGTGSNTFFGLTVFGEITVGGPPPSTGVPDSGTSLTLLGLALAGLAMVRRKLA